MEALRFRGISDLHPPHQQVVAIAVPITDDAGKPVGILMAPITLDTMSRKLVQTKLVGDAQVTPGPTSRCCTTCLVFRRFDIFQFLLAMQKHIGREK
jgi:hypothetical protein